MRPMKPDKEISVSTIRIPTVGGSIPALVLAPKTGAENAVGVLWIHLFYGIVADICTE